MVLGGLKNRLRFSRSLPGLPLGLLAQDSGKITLILPLASAVTSALQPRMVVPIHHDNFMPPISYTMDIRNYRQWLAAEFPKTRFLELTPEEPAALFG